jgi:hypothetical protein
LDGKEATIYPNPKPRVMMCAHTWTRLAAEKIFGVVGEVEDVG